MGARIFLYLIAIVIVMILPARIARSLFQNGLLEMALVPSEEIRILEEVEESTHAARAMWLIRLDIDNPPGAWLPEGYGEAADPATEGEAEALVEETMGDTAPLPPEPAPEKGAPHIPVFYVLPTTYLDRNRWNAPIDGPAARPRQELFAASQSSVFNGVGEIRAPLYRQAVIGAFLTGHRNAEVALRYAYQDVETAFDYFLSEIGEDQPFILVGHSQGRLHITTLLDDRIAGTPLVDRVVAAYITGWPVSVEAGLPALPLQACTRSGRDQLHNRLPQSSANRPIRIRSRASTMAAPAIRARAAETRQCSV